MTYVPLREKKKAKISGNARIKSKGVRNANATGALMVCVNNTAECSYGKEQAYNSSITQTTMKHYTEALNTFNRRQKSQNIS